MKKYLLQMLCVFCLGVATVPGTVLVERWLRNSGSPPAKKFADLTLVDFSLHEDGELEQLDAEHQRQMAVLQKSSAAARVANQIQPDFDSDVEPPVLAQNSPTRTQFKPPSTDLDLEFDPNTVPVKQRIASTNSKAEPPDGIESLADADLSDEQKAKLTTLREKLAELTKAKAELVNEQTLEETIFSLEKQISNLHAAQKLLSAQQILKALAEEFPDSPAAAKAQRMLEAAGFKMIPTVSSDPLSGRPTVRYTVR